MMEQADRQLIPETQDELDTARSYALCKPFIAAGLVLALFAAAFLTVDWSGFLKVASIMGGILSWMFWTLSWSLDVSGAKALEGAGCTRLLSLANDHPAIAEMVRRIRESGRVVLWADLWKANYWLVEQDVAAQERARNQLNGVPS
jgi:hypothetical protein